ncbi:S1C family serine protease [Rubritalea marina]|uniref:S1C family serine protease n=1 Tax=Rubritalea marina TaxID=361055 RepID=UPI000476F9B7|nr:PDZ domain-containing protein [Rubritalea marina]
MKQKVNKDMVCWSMRMLGGAVCAGVLSCSQFALMATPSLPSDELTNGELMRSLFQPQRDQLQKSSAVLYDGWKNFNYGMVVSEDGHILVKASELVGREDVVLRVQELKFTKYEVVAESPRWDLALLKVDAAGLHPVEWASDTVLPIGSVVVANGATSRKRRRINVGVVSAKQREVSGQVPAVIGITFEATSGSLKVVAVNPDAGAAEAGVKEGDRVSAVAGEEVKKRSELIDILRDYQVGTWVDLTLDRDGEKLRVKVELMSRDAVYDAGQTRNDAMSGAYSKRRDGFPMAMQTDIPFNNRTIGGPLLNLDGKCVGMNIARANRAESLAIPVAQLRAELEAMLLEAKKP